VAIRTRPRAARPPASARRHARALLLALAAAATYPCRTDDPHCEQPPAGWRTRLSLATSAMLADAAEAYGVIGLPVDLAIRHPPAGEPLEGRES